MPVDPDFEVETLHAVADAIAATLHKRRETAAGFFGRIIRTGIDEVIDGPRTGRWSLDQLDSTEATYVGTKLEIITRSELSIPKGEHLDARIAGYDADIKWSKTGQWMLGPENFDELCLGLGTDRRQATMSVGLFVAFEARLRRGQNRDAKRSLSAAARDTHVLWLVRDESLPPNFIAAIPENIRTRIFAERSAEARIRMLVTLLPKTPIPRDAFATVALNKDDPLRRLRRDRSKGETLGGMRLLSSDYGKREIKALGLPPLPPNHWIAVPVEELESLSIDADEDAGQD